MSRWTHNGSWVDPKTGIETIEVKCSCCGELRGLHASIDKETLAKAMRTMKCSATSRRGAK